MTCKEMRRVWYGILHSNRFVEQSSDILLTITVCTAQDHDPVFNGQGIQMIEHDMIWLREEGGISTVDIRVV